MVTPHPDTAFYMLLGGGLTATLAKILISKSLKELEDVSSKVSEIKPELAAAVSDIKSEFSTTVSDIKSEFSTTVSDIKSEFSTTVSEIKSELAAIAVHLQAAEKDREIVRIHDRKIAAMENEIYGHSRSTRKAAAPS